MMSGKVRASESDIALWQKSELELATPMAEWSRDYKDMYYRSNPFASDHI